MYRNNKNISIKGNFSGLFLGTVLCVFFAACDSPEKGEVAANLIPVFGVETVGDQTYVRNSVITPLTLPQASGGDGNLTYSLTPSSPATMLPDGLIFNSITRELSGTPTVLGSTEMTYAARDADGDESTLTFNVTVAADTQPSFDTNTVPDQSYTQWRMIPPLQLPQASNGNAPLTYNLSPVPAGLGFNISTRMLTGIPSASLTSTELTYTVEDANGDTATLLFSVVVAANLAPSFTEEIDDQIYIQGTASNPVILPAAMGGDLPLTYNLAPLPDGMTFDTGTRALSGSPTALGSTRVTYTVSDADADTAELMFNIVYRTPPPQVKDICGRTQQVREAIIAAISGTPACNAVTDQQLESINTLALSQKNIASLQTDDFEGLSNLRNLQLWENSLTSLPEDVFDGLTSLRSLSLSDNDLTTLPSDVFGGLTNLVELTLRGNDLASLPEEAFDGLSNIESLGLSNNRLTSLPEDVFDGLTGLTQLFLGDNGLTSPHENLFEGLTSLTQLQLLNNQMTSPHENLFDGLTSLTRLVLSGNNMANLHEDLFEGLTSLQTLDLRNNMLTTLPSDLFDGLTSLMYLDLRGNDSLITPAVCSTGVDCTLP